MNEINWTKVFELSIPIVIAIIGAIVAIYNVRQNIRLSHKLKIKEELKNNTGKLNSLIYELASEVILDNIQQNKMETESFKDKTSHLVFEIERVLSNINFLIPVKSKHRNKIINGINHLSLDGIYSGKESDLKEVRVQLNSIIADIKEFYDDL